MSNVTSDELRVRWEVDEEPYDIGDVDHDPRDEADVLAYVELHGVMGCIVERKCACCGSWNHVSSLWGIVGDDEYHREVEQDLMEEAS